MRTTKFVAVFCSLLAVIVTSGFPIPVAAADGQKSAASQSAPQGSLTPRLVAIGVPDVDASVEWYEQELGFKLRDTKAFPEQGVKISLLERDGFLLEIYRRPKMYSHADVRAAMPQISRWDDVEGFQKLAFLVPDVDAVAARLKRDGVKFAMEMQEASDDIFGKSFIVLDNNGNWIQFCQLKPSIKSRRD